MSSRGGSRGRRGRGGLRGNGRHGGRSEPASSQYTTAAPVGARLATQLPAAELAKVAQYVTRWSALVEEELQAEQDEVKARLQTWGLPRLQREGLVLHGLQAARRGSFFGKTVVKFQNQQRSELPFHRFTPGDLVLLSRRDPVAERTLEGTVMDRSRNELRIVMDTMPPSMAQGLWRLDQGANAVVFQRMKAALLSLYREPTLPSTAGHDAGQSAEAASGSGGREHKRRHSAVNEEDNLPLGTHLRDLLVRPALAAAAQAGQTVFSPEAVRWAEAVAAGGDARLSEHATVLNASQEQALAKAIKHRITLIQGPPGTGKTSTIVKLLQLMKLHWRVPVPVLATAQSNVAVDNLLEGLLEHGVNAVRVGQPVKVRQALRDATLDARIEAHPAAEAIEKDAMELRNFRRQLPSLRGRDRGLGHARVSRMAADLKRRRVAMLNEVLQGAEVVCCTCAGAGSDTLEGLQFPLVVLDEGSQCCEPESLIPLTRGCQQAILVGDHHQLPPVCTSREAAAKGLSLSLFERLVQAGVPTVMLQVQYRMHPSLAAFPSRQFYSGRLINGVTAEQRPTPAFPFPVPGHPLVFINVQGQEAVSQGGSKYNRMEAEVVVACVQHLLQNGLPATNIGVVTPYVAQMTLLSEKLASSSTGGELEVRSVDGYQGREKDVIVFSAVRSNANSQVGFLEDWRRMNVAITRAKSALLLVGCTGTLQSGDRHWAALIKHCQELGVLVERSNVPV